jgi:predicted AlkP superfamily phosphohydrolase/phosphomutase
MAKNRVIVIGLDGATLDLVEQWAQDGTLPNLAELMATGTTARLQSVIPPITAPAWTSFMTGKNPGKHGVYDFLGRDPDDYKIKPYNASHCDSATLWELASQADKRVCAINVPMTYPPRPVNGYMIAGMGTPPTAEDFCWPAEALAEIRGVIPDYQVQPSGIFDPVGREAEMLQSVRGMTEMRLKTALHFLQRNDWDLFTVVFMATDLIQHYFWHYMDPTHLRYDDHASQELRSAIRDCYRQLDSGIGLMLKQGGDDALVIIMSDHGFGILEYYLHMNTWLWQHGYLSFKRHPLARIREHMFRMGITSLSVYEASRKLRQIGPIARALRRDKEATRSALHKVFLSFDDVDWEQTRAYSVGNIGSLYINLKGREPQGIVAPGSEYESVVTDIVSTLKQSCDPKTGLPIVDSVHRREDIYRGPHLDEAPDLLFLPRDMKHVGIGQLQFATNQWVTVSDRSGGHRLDGLLCLHGPEIRRGHEVEDAGLIDLAPTILAAMGVPVPRDMDGSVLLDAFADDSRVHQRIRYATSSTSPERAAASLSEQDEEGILDRLRGLGYVA